MASCGMHNLFIYHLPRKPQLLSMFNMCIVQIDSIVLLLSISYCAFLRWIASPNMTLHSPLHLKSNFKKHNKKKMQCQTNRLRYLFRAYILQTIKILEKKYRLNYELQQIFVVTTLEKQTTFKEVKKLNNDFQQLFIVVRER